MIAALALALGLSPTVDGVGEAESLAAAALRESARAPEAALAKARRALALTAEFDPTAFVRPGRKGEVVEDAYVVARNEYRRHRARLYEAVGTCLARPGQNRAAVRYLRRAVLLAPEAPRVLGLARALLAVGQGDAVLEAMEKTAAAGSLPPEAVPLVAQAADAAGLPSAQVEIDRWRLSALPGVEFRDGPVTLPAGVRLSTNPVFRLEDVPITVFYHAEASCRSCSEDLQALKRGVRPGARVVTVPELPDQDQALRQVLALYRYDWPVLLGRGVVEALRLKPRTALIVARAGWAAAAVKAPFGTPLTSAIGFLEKTDLAESLPRPAWNHRPVQRRLPPEPPGLLPDGLAPGEDEPAPPEFTAAVEAYRGRRPAEALRLFEALEAKGDGWLLPPEARLDRGLCLAALGRREEARLLLLHTGDSRFQEAVDRALEAVGSPRRDDRKK